MLGHLTGKRGHTSRWFCLDENNEHCNESRAALSILTQSKMPGLSSSCCRSIHLFSLVFFRLRKSQYWSSDASKECERKYVTLRSITIKFFRHILQQVTRLVGVITNSMRALTRENLVELVQLTARLTFISHDPIIFRCWPSRSLYFSLETRWIIQEYFYDSYRTEAFS